jgi:hypothetical protein
MRHGPQEPFRTPTDAYRLTAMGFHLAEQVITAAARARERRDVEFRNDLAPVRVFLRPHVFVDRAARDLACRSPVRGDVLALEPVDADEVRFRWRTSCLFAIGHGIDDPGFEEVAYAIADPEIICLVERSTRGRASDGKRDEQSIYLTVSGALYQLRIDEEGQPEVRVKVPFGVVSQDEGGRTAMWLLDLLVGRLEFANAPEAWV